MATWHTIASARDEWPDAPVDYEDGGDDTLITLLAVAKEAVVAFAPVITSTAPDPVTLTDAGWTVELSGVDDKVTAVLASTGAGIGTVVVPAEFRPVGYPEFNVDLNNRAYFSIGNNAVLDMVSDAAQTFTMFWESDDPAPNEVIPEGYRQAQLMQARNVWNASKANPQTGDFDNGSYSLSSFPLDWAVRQLIRPKRGKPVIG